MFCHIRSSKSALYLADRRLWFTLLVLFREILGLVWYSYVVLIADAHQMQLPWLPETTATIQINEVYVTMWVLIYHLSKTFLYLMMTTL